ncbi:MAG: glycosyltransferase family 39 protein [Candidatus Riflebacteria bacterium]|nr:glycosyltransferase family 39 protein [Candidatus Riflebacteria bacterium]
MSAGNPDPRGDPVTGSDESGWPRHIVFAVGGAVLLGFCLRTWGADFGLPYVYHYDDVLTDYMVLRALAQRLRPVIFMYDDVQTSILACFHGVLFVSGWLTTSSYGAVEYLTDHVRDPSTFTLCGRAVSAVSGSLSALAIALVCGRLGGRWCAVSGAMFVAVASAGVQESHNLKGHTLAACLAAFSLYVIVKLLDVGGRRVLLGAGFLLGLTIAAKPYAVALLPALAVSLWFSSQLKVRALAMLAGGAVGGYAVGNPTVFLYPVLTFEAALKLNSLMKSLYGTPWVDTGGLPLWLFYWFGHLRNTLGTPMFLACISGIVAGIVTRHRGIVVVTTFLVSYTVLLHKSSGFTRYMLPLELGACATAAFAVSRVCQNLRWRGAACLTLSALVILVPLRNDVAYDALLSSPDTRTRGAQWLTENVEPGATVIIEGTDSPFLRSFLGPQVRPSPDRVRAELQSKDPNAQGRLLQAILRVAEERPIRLSLENVVGLDEVGGGIDNVDLFRKRGVRYLVSINWVPRRRHVATRYAAEFQRDLDRHYEKIKTFVPEPILRFDPVAWQVDYEKLWQVDPFDRRLVLGPLIEVYKIRE